MINGINLKALRNSEYLRFMKDLVTIIGENNPATLGVQAPYALFSTQVSSLDTLFKLSDASELTEELFKLDTRRDNAIVGIRAVVDGHRYHFDDNYAAAARLLFANLNLYGDEISKMNYQAESTTIEGIVNDWENKQELTDAMTLLGLKDWKNELKATNELFIQKYLERTNQYGDATEETLGAERVETNQFYYDLRDHLWAQFIINKTPERTTAINRINAFIDQYNVLLSRKPATEGDAAV